MEELLDQLINESLGFFIWSTLAFVLLVVLLKKIAWKPILTAIAHREHSIEDALSKAAIAKAEAAKLAQENEALLKQARSERDLILKKARQIQDQIIQDAKVQAQQECAKIMEQAQLEINHQRAIALAYVQNQVADLSLSIAEKVLRKELADKQQHDALVSSLLKEVSWN